VDQTSEKSSGVLLRRLCDRLGLIGLGLLERGDRKVAGLFDR
jgi:hypothetical protein